MVFGEEVRVIDSSENSTSQFIYCPNISNFRISQAKISNYIVTTSAAACLIVTLVLHFLLLLYRAYRTALQRLFFHYILSNSVSLACTALMIELQFDITREFCSWLAFVKEWWYLNSNLFLVCLTVTLTVTTYTTMRSKPIGFCRSSKMAVTVEILFTILAFTLPLSYLWITMKKHRFGLYGSVCWIEMYNESCILVGKGELRFSTVIVLLKLIVVVLYSTLLVVLHLVIIKKYKQDRKSRLKILCRALSLMVVCIISLLRVIIHHVISHPKVYPKLDHAFYDTIDALLENCLAVLLPMAFGLYIFSPSKLKWRELKKACEEFPVICSSGCKCCKLKMVNLKPVTKVGKTDGNPQTFEDSSDRVVPSHTTYSSPYTNEFTDITEIISKEAHYGSMAVRVKSQRKNM